MASGSTIAISGTPLRIIDLSGALPSETDYPPPPINNGGNGVGSMILVFAAASASRWVLGNQDGAVLDGASLDTTPRYFGFGNVRSIAGSPSRLAVATSIGKVLLFDTSDFSLETALDISAAQLAISADAGVLALQASGSPNLTFANDASVRTVSLPSGTVIKAWPYTYPSYPYPADIELSTSGALLGQVLYTGSSSSMRQVTSSNGGPILWSDIGSPRPIRLSLDDALIAAADAAGANTTVYLNGVKSAVVPGWAAGWLANEDLLVGNSIYNSAGIKQSTLPQLEGLYGPIQVLSATSIYDPTANGIFSLESGAQTWSTTSNLQRPAAVAGSRVVFVTNSNQLVIEPY
jgi:hypothetical protein